MHTQLPFRSMTPTALVWLDRSHALIAMAGGHGTVVTEVDRDLDTEPGYLQRVAEQAAACDRLVVIGSDTARAAFEEEFLAIYHRPERLIDAGLEVEPEPRELIDRLRFLGLDPPDRD